MPRQAFQTSRTCGRKLREHHVALAEFPFVLLSDIFSAHPNSMLFVEAHVLSGLYLADAAHCRERGALVLLRLADHVPFGIMQSTQHELAGHTEHLGLVLALLNRTNN